MVRYVIRQRLGNRVGFGVTFVFLLLIMADNKVRDPGAALALSPRMCRVHTCVIVAQFAAAL